MKMYLILGKAFIDKWVELKFSLLKLTFLFILIVSNGFTFGQKPYLNLGIDTTSNENHKEIARVWAEYFLAISKDSIDFYDFWIPNELEKFAYPDILGSDGYLNPNLYGLRTDNILYNIHKIRDSVYQVKSIFFWKRNEKLIQ